MTTPYERLRYHVTGAIERGEAVPIVEVPVSVTPVIDYCTHGCVQSGQPDVQPVTPWVVDRCGCCGGAWGESQQGACRGIHIEGDVWRELLDHEQGV